MDDLYFLFRVFNTDRAWAVPGALTTPGLVRARAESGRLTEEKRDELRRQLTRVQEMARRHGGTDGSGKELHRIARWLAEQWRNEDARRLLG